MSLSKVIEANRRTGAAQAAPRLQQQAPSVAAPRMLTTADAYQRLNANISSANRLRQTAGALLTPEEARQLEQIGSAGVLQHAGSGLASIFNWLDRPRKLVALGIRDLMGFDSNRGAEIEGGDYWLALQGKNMELEERLGTDVVGEGGNLGFSQLLDDVWEYDPENMSWLEKTGRFTASLAGDLATDPLSWMTSASSGLGKVATKTAVEETITKAAARAGVRLADDFGVAASKGTRELGGELAEGAGETALEKTIVERARGLVDNKIDEYVESVGDDAIEALGPEAWQKQLDDFVRDEAIPDAVGITRRADDAAKVVVETPGGAAADIMNEVTKRVVNRDFGRKAAGYDSGLWKSYVDHVYTRRGGKRLGSAITVGGVRLTIPFAVAKSSRPILQGAGRSINRKIGRALGKLPTARRYGHRLEKAMARFDANKPGILMAKRGLAVQERAIRAAGDQIGAEFSQFGNAALRAMDDVEAAVRKEAGKPLSRRGTLIGEATVEAEELLQETNRAILKALQSPGTGLPSDIAASLPKAVREAAEKALPAIESAYVHALATARKVNPELRAVDGHVPFYLDDQFARVMRSIVTDNKMFELPADEAAARLLANHLDVKLEDLVRFVEIADVMSPGLAGGGRLGWAREWNRRTTGRTAVDAAAELPPEGTSLKLADDVLMLQPAMHNVEEISDSLTKVLTAFVEKEGLPYKIKNVKQALEEDPGAQLAKYLGASQENAIQAAIIQKAKSYGLIRNPGEIELLDAVLATVAEEVPDAVAAYVTAMVRRSEKSMQNASKSLYKTETVRLGNGMSVDIPAELAGTKPMRKAVAKAREAIRKADQYGANVAAQRKQATQRLRRENPSLTEAQAAQLSAMTSTALTEFRIEALEAARAFDQEVQRALLDATSYLKTSQEAIDLAADAKSSSSSFVQEVEQQLARLDEQFAAKYRSAEGARNELSLTVRNADGTVNAKESTRRIDEGVLKPIRTQIADGLRVKLQAAVDGWQAMQDEMLDEATSQVRKDQLGLALDVAHERREFYLELLAGSMSRGQAEEHIQIVLNHYSQDAGRQFMIKQQDGAELGFAVLSSIKGQENIAKRGWAAYQAWLDADHPMFGEVGEAVMSNPQFRKMLAVGAAVQDRVPASVSAEALQAETQKVAREMAGWTTSQVDNYLRNPRGQYQINYLSQIDTDIADIQQGYRNLALNTSSDMMDDWLAYAADAGVPEAPLGNLAVLYSDPARGLQRSMDGLGALNRLVKQYVRPDVYVDIVMDGDVPVVRLVQDQVIETVALPAGVKNMDELAAGLDSGRIAKDAVPSADRAKAAVFSELRRARQRARVEAGQGRAAATRQATKISQFNQVADQFDDLVTGVLTGTYTANRLKNWAYRADGSFTPEMNRLLRTLGEDSATGPDAVKRLVRTLLTADDSVSPVSKRVLEQNEGRWANTVMRPVEQSLREIENVTAELTAAARAELDDDIADTLGKAADFINEFTEYTHLVGAEVDSLGRPIGGGARAAAYQSAEVKSKRESVKAAAAALETPTKAEKDLVKKIQDALAGTDVPPVTTRPEGFATASQLGLEGRLEGAVIDEYLGLMFENMVQTTRAIHTPWGMQQLQQSSKEIVRWWKSAATVSKPSFHVRNMISGVANGLLIGVGPENYRRMALPLRTFRRLHADGVELNEIFSLMRREHGEHIGDMFEAAWNNGVFQGFSRAEGLAFTGRLPSAGSKLAPWNPSNVFFRGGGKVMESMEDMLRMAAFDRHYHGKGTERLAAQMVIAVHFDYQHLTMLERKFKKFAPFFVWTRRNLPLQLQMLLERPGMINMWNHLQRNLEEVGGGFNGLPLSQYASPLAAPIDHDPSNEGSPLWARMIWDPDLPVRILDEIPAFAVPNEDGLMPVQIGSLPDWINWSAQLLGPQFTLPLNIVRAEEFGDVEAPRGLHDIIYGIDGLVEAGGLDLPGVDTSSGAARIPRWLRSSIETAVPFMSEYRQFLGYTPMDPNRTAREGLAPDDQDTFIAAVLKGDFDGAASGLLSGRGPTAGTLRGLGVNYQTPNDTRGAAYEAQEIVRDIRGRVSRAASN